MRLDSELISLLSLIDDPDTVVKEAVMSRLLSKGDTLFDQLSDLIYNEPSEEKRSDYYNIMEYVRSESVFSNVENFLKAPDPLLIDGLFLISKSINNILERYQFFYAVELLAQELSYEISDEKTAIENVEIFNYIFFRRIGFKHTDPLMQSDDNALINKVLDSKKGNPISISLIYFMLSRSVGLPIYPLCFPGGFVPVYLDKDNRILFYLNIFKSGGIFLEDRLKNFFEEIGLSYNKELLIIEKDRALVSIYVELLCFIYKANPDKSYYEKVSRIINMFGSERFL